MYCTHDCAVCQRWEGTLEEWQKFSALQRSEWKAQKPNQVALMHDIAGAWEALKIDECALRRHAQQKAGRSRSRQILLPLPRQILLPISRGALPRQRHVPAPLPRGGTTPPRHSPRKGESAILFPICSNYQLIVLCADIVHVRGEAAGSGNCPRTRKIGFCIQRFCNRIDKGNTFLNV